MRKKELKCQFFILFFGLISIAGKRFPQLHDLYFILFYFAVWFLILPISQYLPSLWFFFLGTSQEVLSTNYLDLLVFFYQFFRGFRFFLSIDIPVFFHHFLLGFRGFSSTTMLIIFLYAQQSLFLGWEANVITWSPNLVTWLGDLILSPDMVRKPHPSNFIKSRFLLISKYHHPQTYVWYTTYTWEIDLLPMSPR